MMTPDQILETIQKRATASLNITVITDTEIRERVDPVVQANVV
jgi:hypothetical protein